MAISGGKRVLRLPLPGLKYRRLGREGRAVCRVAIYLEDMHAPGVCQVAISWGLLTPLGVRPEAYERSGSEDQ